MKLFRVNKEYLEHIQKDDSRLLRSTNLVGILERLNGFIYFIPITNTDNSDYNNDGSFKTNTRTIFRLIDSKQNRLIGKCLLSNMFPVPYNDVIPLNYKSLQTREIQDFNLKLDCIKRMDSRIKKSIKLLYKQKANGHHQPYLDATVDFKKLEKTSLVWESEKYGRHINRFPDSHFFITNPNTSGLSNYYLMHKDIKVLSFTLDNQTLNIKEILEILQPEHAPLGSKEDNRITARALTTWFKGRGIPSWREGLDSFLDNLGITDKSLLLNRAFGLSLTDQYWLNPLDALMNWNDVNFFTNNFTSRDYIEASFEDKFLNQEDIDFYSPNNTSDGILKKAWIVEGNKRYLIKASLNKKQFEPFNEVLATLICDSQNFSHTKYTIELINNEVCSKCECFINENTELLSAYSILQPYLKNNKEGPTFLYQKYINTLESYGIENTKEKLAEMFILDYLIVNEDRHLGNFGVIRDANSLAWLDIAPIFDSGNSMFAQKDTFEMNFETAYATFINNKNVNYESILVIALENTIVPINFDSLNIVIEEWRKLLNEYKYSANITDERIETLINGLTLRIKKLHAFYNNK